MDLLLEFRDSKWKDVDFHHLVKRLVNKIANGKKNEGTMMENRRSNYESSER